MGPRSSGRLFPHLSPRVLVPGLLVLAAMGACGLSYEPEEGLGGGTAEDIGRSMVAGAQANKMQIAVAGSADGWRIRHGRDAEVYENELYLPFDRNVVLSVSGGGEDASLNIPVFGVRKLIEAGKRTKVYFRVVRTGEFPMEWAPVRGRDGRVVEGRVVVVTQAEWDELFTQSR